MHVRVCGSPPPTAQRVPFCSLPPGVRSLIAGGFQAGRSPDVLTVSAGAEIAGSSADASGTPAVPWISLTGPAAARVPLVFAGPGIAHAAVDPGTGLDTVAPTVAPILGVRRPAPPSHASRSGAESASVASTTPPRLVLLLAWEGVGSRDLRSDPERWPFLDSLVRTGAATLDAETGSLPLDPAAVLTTIGTGARLSQHGITGTALRSTFTGAIQRAGAADAPPAELPTLAQDLVRQDRSALVALVEPSPVDVGLVGAEYYIGLPLPTVRVTPPGHAVAAASALLEAGMGADETSDVPAVVLRGPVSALDRGTRRLVALADRASGSRFVTVVAGTGSATTSGGAMPAGNVGAALERRLPASTEIVEEVTPGGIFLRRHASSSGVTSHDLTDALLRLPAPGGRRLMADAFPSFAVSLERYCS